ncbi:MAG TPA: VCBS repeat-containing protein, partial [Polyangia bacterium]|nr:VCBS repeat-containing protein [Polyangia bacterium]
DDVTLLIGRIGGGFAAGGGYAVGENPAAMAAGDLNADGHPDLVVAGPPRDPGPGGGGGPPPPEGMRVHVLLSQPGGRFTPTADYPAGPRPAAVTVADVDGDGDLDLAVAGMDGQVLVLLNQGKGQFAPGPATRGGASLRAIAAGDVDGNGRPDLVVVDAGDGANAPAGVAVLLGQGSGTFSPPAAVAAAGRGPAGLALVDLDGDTRLDVAVASHDSDAVSVLYGRAGGAFDPAVPLAAGGGPLAVAVGDVDGDGRLDLAVANELGNDVSVLRGTGARSWAPAVHYPAGAGPAAVATADTNGDGRLDLIVASTITNDVTVLVNQGGGDYAVMATMPFLADQTPRAPSTMISGDLDGDGFSDLVVAARDTNEVFTLLGRGGTRFDPPVRASTDPAASLPTALALGDVNGDGLLDLAVANEGSDNVTVLLGQTDPIGQTGGQIQWSLGQGTSYPSGDGPSAVALADLDGDGRLDLIVAHANDNNFAVLYNRGDAANLFGGAVPYATGARPSALGTGDFDGDGRTDVAVAVADGAVNLFFNTRDGRINYVGNLNVGLSPRALAVADLDNDGQPDLMTANEGSGDVSVLLNRGHGSFLIEPHLPVGAVPTALAIRDLNGDSRPDLATVNADDTVRVFLNSGGSGFQTETARIFQVGMRPVAVVLEDFNRDSRPDLAVANADSGNLTLLLNLSR